MKENTKSLISTFSAIEICEKKFGSRAFILSNLGKIGYPVVEGFFISSDIIQQIEMGHQTPKFSIKFLESGPFCLRSSAKKKEMAGPEPFLYLGLNKEKIEELSKNSGRKILSLIYLNHIKNFGIRIFDLEADFFEYSILKLLKKKQLNSINYLNMKSINFLISEFEEYYRSSLGFGFPEDPSKQIHYALKAFVNEWQSPTSKILRSSLGVPNEDHIGAIIQKMIFKNLNSYVVDLELQFIDSNTGEEKINGRLKKIGSNHTSSKYFEGTNFNKLLSKKIEFGRPKFNLFSNPFFKKIKALDKKTYDILGKNFNFSFILGAKELYLVDAKEVDLQTSAIIKLYMDQAKKGIISKEQMISKIEPEMLVQSLHPQISQNSKLEIIGVGLPASPGGVSGRIAFSAEEAIRMSSKGITVILVRSETSSEDIRGMHASDGVLTLRGGMSSHAAVVARGLGKPCVVGVSNLIINSSLNSIITSGEEVLKSGDIVTIDGSNGRVLKGNANMVKPKLPKYFFEILDWASDRGKISVKANADTIKEAEQAKGFKVDGIGLCRTEHMFFEKKSLQIMQKILLSPNENDKLSSIGILSKIQELEFKKIFRIMRGKTVTTRLLDLPVHEFLPNSISELEILADEIKMSFLQVSERCKQMSEINPMLGKRGVRLGILLPELYKMQVKAIIKASINVYGKNQTEYSPEIMLPMVSSFKEVNLLKNLIDNVVSEISNGVNFPINYRLGVMVETPRAALNADELAKISSFLSFGTNDLTQMTYGLSRDDSGTFMRDYLEREIFPVDPFRSLDLDGVGELLKIASKKSRDANPSIKIGMCGEHGGDPKSIDFCKKIGLDFVSCSPFRVPIARIAAAQ
ncbi:MAG: putative PEP-binding protein [Paracoccaceae bacterium]